MNVRRSQFLWIIVLTSLLLGSPLVAQEATDEKAEEKTEKKPDLPLKAERKVEFTTDEATWLSLDVTPDGRSIIFEILGDFYRIPMAGGKAERITEGQGFDSQPRISPDGQWIAFISDRDGSDNLWIAKIDGSEPRKLSSEKQNGMISPSWTPDSKYTVVSRTRRGTELRMYHIDGGSGLTVASARPSGTPAPSGNAPSGPARLGARMSPDGRYLYFAQAASAGRGGGRNFPLWQIARRDMKSGDVDVITQAEGSAIRPLLSPDGRLLVYATRHETQTGLRIRNLNSGADRWLTYPVQRDEQESGGSLSRDTFPNYAFTPDGQSVLYTNNGKIHRVNIATGASSLIPFSADVSLDIGPDLDAPYRVEEGPVRARLVQDPQQSPDGKQLVFSVLTKLYLMDLPGGEPRRLTQGDAWEFKPVWSPDGRWIAYVSWTMQGGHIWKIPADGSSQPQRLTQDYAFYTDLTFSPDGQRIVGLRGNSYMRHQTFSEFGGLRIPLDLVWLSAAGGEVQLIVPGRGVGVPHFTTDTDRIYVYSREGLISLRYDGTDRQTHLKVTGPPNPRSPRPPAAQTVLIRPDGKWALAAVNNQLHVVAVPTLGGAAPTVSITSPAVPAQRITDIGAGYYAWADGGKTITWAIGLTFYRRPFDTIRFEKKKEGRGRDRGGNSPDQEEAEKAESKEKKKPLDLEESVEAISIVMEFPRAKPEGTIVLEHATVISMNGDEVLENTDIVVTDNRIAAIGRSGRVDIPSDAHRVDVRGKFVVPGFIDTHAHWEFRTHDVLEPQNWSLVANLAYGVTAGLDVQTSTNDYFAYQDLGETGQSLGQRAFMTGPGVFSTNNFQSYAATLSYLRRYKEHYRTPNIKSYMVGNRQQRQWVVMASKELGLMPTTEGGRNLKLDLSHAIDGFHGNEHTLPVVPSSKT